MSTPIARYYASLGIQVDKKSVATVDTTLKRIEKKLKDFGKLTKSNLNIKLKISKFDIDQRKLVTEIGDALDVASNKLVLEIKRFDIDKLALQRALKTSNVGASLSGAMGGNTYINNRVLSGSEWDRREAEKQRLWWERRNALREDEQRRAAERAMRPVRPGNYSYNNSSIIGAGGVAGAAARAYMPALALAGGGYGAGWLNRRNQEVVSSQLMTQAVVQQAGGTAEQGMQSFDWLRSQANRVGFNYLDAAPDFNKLISGLTGAGMSVEQGQETFKGFAELSRVNKLDKTSQNRLFRALSQVAGKNQLMSEELTGQIAEALPGGVALFAEAYQRQTGGKLQGTEAIQALRAAMEKRQVKGDILPIAAQIASEKAASGLSLASRASQAEQARAQNALNDQAITASKGGVESGFARLFRTFAISLNESTPLVETMARSFDRISFYASETLLSVQSMTRFFQGRDSLLGDKLFPDEESKNKAFLFLEQFKTMMTEMDKLTENIYNGWSMILEKLSSSKILDTFNTSLSIMANTAATFNKLAEGDISGAMDAAGGAGKKYINTITAPGRSGANALLSTFTDRRIPVPFSDADSQLDWQANYRAEQARLAAMHRNQYALPGVNQPLNGMNAANLEIKMDVKINAANPEDFNQKFQDQFKSVIQSTLQQYSQKE